MPNYILLEKITVGAAGASSVTFSGIPQTGYTDLKVVYSLRTNLSGGPFYFDDLAVRLNGDTGSNYSRLTLRSREGSVGSNKTSPTTFMDIYAGNAANATANTFANGEFYIPNYTSSNYKSLSSDGVTENNSANDVITGFAAGLWSSTAAVTSLTIYSQNSTSFVQGSTAYLYGVAKLGTTPAIVPYATGGDTIMTDGTYWYHTFLSSGTFTPQKSLSCDYLVVAGGGGGGANGGGGGGAGGLRSTVTATGGGGSLESALSLGTSAYTVTVGAGGAGGGTGGAGTTGSNSVFSTITSNGGGGGGSNVGSAGGKNGGSGGGENNTANGIGTGTANQGFNGGSGGPNGGGGGGGAGQAGNTNGQSYGGNGVAVSITGSSVTYAGGGGGYSNLLLATAPGGTGGGGTANPNQNGTANTGGGGGAWNGTNSAGTGGSGIVIVRYAV